MNKPEYPECEKWAATKEQRTTIIEFLEWLNSQKIWLCDAHKNRFLGSADEEYFPITKSTDNLLYEFFGIDYWKLDNERRAMLEAMQQQDKQ